MEGPRFFGSREPYIPLAARPDVLVFETAPLEEDVEVTGAIAAKLWIASDRPDTDFTLKLIDVYPPNPDYPARVRHEPDRRHPARALPQILGASARC